ncbi:hypothetical protein A3735_07560 [Oleiphilus sp. HI0061]|uniref:hypothetical protein n=1 Tax=Oleiphilus sp. HI0061 TaxID=1822239 RepID=UPI0007D0201F|nr:hypothetical protein [Oleiphilus sp. HI0061]KZY65921.1 hypothetical protein A3735_07560 [Oleiphilus sp. HI0061]
MNINKISLVLMSSLVVVFFVQKYKEDNLSIAGFESAKVLGAKACSEGFCGFDVILIDGIINNNTSRELSKFLKGRKQSQVPDIVCFNSPGGGADGAFELGNLIAQNKLNTCVADEYLLVDGNKISNVQCGSACPYALLAGKRRVLHGLASNIWVHSSGSTSVFFGTRKEISEEERFEDKVEFKERIDSYSKINNGRQRYKEAHDALVEYSFTIPHMSIQTIDPAKLVSEYFVITDLMLHSLMDPGTSLK